MIQKLSNTLEERFRISGDKTLWLTIIDDMIVNGGDKVPATHWVKLDSKDRDATIASAALLEQCRDDSYWQRFDNLAKMLDPIIGCTGMLAASEADYKRYRDFLKLFTGSPDAVAPLMHVIDQGNSNLAVADLGSLMDLALIQAGLPATRSDKKLNIFEIGGGYGRLVEAFFNSRSPNISYVLIDAVPGSLMYAYMYLKKHLPLAKIGFYYNGDEPSLEDFDIYICPAWHFQKSAFPEFDLAINVESFQEMNERHVHGYIELIDDVLRLDGIVYLSNAKDYVLRTNVAYPDHWRCLFRQNTPRSWTPDHPTELFQKSDRSCVAFNELQEIAYRYGLNERAESK